MHGMEFGYKFMALRLADAMDATEHFIAIENIEHFFACLGAKDGQDERKILTRLLLEEENRFARDSERLDLLDRYIAKCDGHIMKQKRLIEAGNMASSLMNSAYRLLSNFQDIRSILVRTKVSLEQANRPPEGRKTPLSVSEG